MNFADLELNNYYESGVDNLIKDFYVPVLSSASRYDRLAGFFSSTSLAIAAKGIAGLINNKGRMRIIACPQMSNDDVEVINNASTQSSSIIESILFRNLENMEDDFANDHLAALGWLLVNGYLEIKIALVYGNNKKLTYMSDIAQRGIFHQKVGILWDAEGNAISFSGSINETASGWLDNIEEFKVFRSWDIVQNEYLLNDIKKFDDMWDNKRPNLEVMSIPEAVQDKLMGFSYEFDVDKICLSKYLNKQKNNGINLFEYQKKAVSAWLANNCRLLFEMATGTGKTRTAISCINELSLKNNRLIVIVSTPQSVLSIQWEKQMIEFNVKFDKSIICDSSNNNWKDNLTTFIRQMNVGFIDKLIIYTTHKTSSSDDFLRIIVSTFSGIPILYVGDEVHGLGAHKFKKGLSARYKYRLGLSATPQRWFDDVGTKIIKNYFGDNTYEFSIKDALTQYNPATNKTFLTPYYYYPHFIELLDSEMEEYQKLSQKISQLSGISKESDEYQRQYEMLLFKRAQIIKNAYNKIDELKTFIKDIDNAIIFVSDKQIDDVMDLLKNSNIVFHKITQEISVCDRQEIIDSFCGGFYKVLVAIKCLDEGIDIPRAEMGVILSSSTNPREYVQRIGRVLRRYDGKTHASIHDFIVIPDLARLKDELLKDFELKIFNKEMTRVIDMSNNSLNNAGILEKVYEVRRRVCNVIK